MINRNNIIKILQLQNEKAILINNMNNSSNAYAMHLNKEKIDSIDNELLKFTVQELVCANYLKEKQIDKNKIKKHLQRFLLNDNKQKADKMFINNSLLMLLIFANNLPTHLKLGFMKMIDDFDNKNNMGGF